MQNIFWGALIIAIGLVLGSSIFLGDFGWLNVLFDGLGLVWIATGAREVYRKRVGAGARSGDTG